MRINHVHTLIPTWRIHQNVLLDRVIIIYRVSLHVSLMFQHILGSGRKYIY